MASWLDGGAMGCSQTRALTGRLDARGVLLCHLRPAVGRGRVVLFRIFGHFWSFPAPVQIGWFPAGLAGKFTAALIEESTITVWLSSCPRVPAVVLFFSAARVAAGEGRTTRVSIFGNSIR